MERKHCVPQDREQSRITGVHAAYAHDTHE